MTPGAASPLLVSSSVPTEPSENFDNWPAAPFCCFELYSSWEVPTSRGRVGPWAPEPSLSTHPHFTQPRPRWALQRQSGRLWPGAGNLVSAAAQAPSSAPSRPSPGSPQPEATPQWCPGPILSITFHFCLPDAHPSPSASKGRSQQPLRRKLPEFRERVAHTLPSVSP